MSRVVLFTLFVAFAVLSSVFAAPQCATSGQRSGCSDVQTFPCLWTDRQCEFQYDRISLTCEGVPDIADMSITCSPTVSTKQYELDILDELNYSMKKAWRMGHGCINNGTGLNDDGNDCPEWVTGDYSWSTTGYGVIGEPIGDVMTIISMVDHNTCLDITCTIDISI
jgi:hypothetical protein